MEEAERLNGRLVHLRPDALDETGDLLAQFLHKRRRHPVEFLRPQLAAVAEAPAQFFEATVGEGQVGDQFVVGDEFGETRRVRRPGAF